MTSTDSSPIDLVIPVYNEAHVLETSLRRLAQAMDERADDDSAFEWRIVVINNGSTDATLDVAGRLAAGMPRVEVVDLDRKGRGRALRKTWTETDAQFSLYMDVDLSTDLSAVSDVVRRLRDGADVVTGSRLHPDAQITRCFRREFLSRNYNRLIRCVLRTRSFDDAQCGFKGVRVAAVRRLLPLICDQEWFFDTELLVLAEYAGMSIHNLPIAWIEDPDSRVNVPQTVWQDLRGLFRLRRTARKLVRGL